MAHSHSRLGDPERHGRRTEERISAAIHRHRTGVIGLAPHRDLKVGGSRDRRDDTEARSVVLEDRTLLDVQLDEDIEISADGCRGCSRVQADPAHRLGQAHAIRVPHAVGLARLEPIGDRARAPEVRIEAAALFLADRDAFEYSGGSAEPLPEAAHRLDARDDAERSVECAAATHRVDMRAGRNDPSAA